METNDNFDVSVNDSAILDLSHIEYNPNMMRILEWDEARVQWKISRSRGSTTHTLDPTSDLDWMQCES